MVKLFIVCATKLSLEGFGSSCLAKSLDFLNIEHELILYPNNSEALPVVYNDAIQRVKNIPSYVLFVHDDVQIMDLNFSCRLKSALEKFDVIGVAGSICLREHMSMWCLNGLDIENLDIETTNLAGAIVQGVDNNQTRYDFFGPPNVSVVAIDGCFISMKSSIFSSGITFDQLFEFHHYDIDFSLTAKQFGFNVGVVDIPITHYSPGNLSAEWVNSGQRFLNKWRQYLGG